MRVAVETVFLEHRQGSGKHAPALPKFPGNYWKISLVNVHTASDSYQEVPDFECVKPPTKHKLARLFKKEEAEDPVADNLLNEVISSSNKNENAAPFASDEEPTLELYSSDGPFYFLKPSMQNKNSKFYTTILEHFDFDRK